MASTNLPGIRVADLPDTDCDQRASINRRFNAKLTPYLTLLYFFLFLDRQNISFAGIQMTHDLGLTAAAFGMAIGLFSIGYCLFELPSTLLLRRFGARTWLARIMVTWGLMSAATAFASGSHALYVLRFLLGAAEAGFVPGVIYYLTTWVPASERSAVVGVFMVAVPLSSVVGAPVSGALLGLHWLGMQGWQWLFLLEGAPAAILGLSILRFLPDKPDDVDWLTPDDKAWLTKQLTAERAHVSQVGASSIGVALRSPMVLLLGLIYLGNGVGLFGIAAWLPTLTRNLGFSYMKTGFVVSSVYLLMATVMILWTRNAAKKQEYVLHLAAASLLGVACIAAGALAKGPALVVTLLALSNILLSPSTPTFWNLPPQYLSGPAAAVGIALISSIGALGAFIGPAMIGVMKDHSGNYSAGLLWLSVGPALAALLTLSLRWHRAFKPRAHAGET